MRYTSGRGYKTRLQKCGDGICEGLTSASQHEIPVRLPKQLEPDKLMRLLRKGFQLRSRNSVARAQPECDALHAFHFVRQIFGGLPWRLAGKHALNVRAIIADILPALHTNGRDRAGSDSQIIFAQPVGAIMN